MSILDFHHGVDLVEVNDGIRTLQVVRSSIIFLQFTAPDADPALWPADVPQLIAGNPNDKRVRGLLGKGGTGEHAFADIYDESFPVVIAVRHEQGSTDNITMANFVGKAALNTGVWSATTCQSRLGFTPKIWVAPGYDHQRPTLGTIASATPNQQGSGYDNTTTITINDVTGTGAQVAPIIGAGVNAGKIVGYNVIRGGVNYTAPTFTISGPGTGASANIVLGAGANPVVKSHEALMPRMRATGFYNGPDTTYEDMVAYRADFGTDRTMLIWPGAEVFDVDLAAYVPRPSSARWASRQADVDDKKGFWWSVSNQQMGNIGATTQPVDFYINDPNCMANILNAQDISTIVRKDTGGFWTWGNRTTSSDPNWAFLAVRRAADAVYDTMERGFTWAVDRPGTPNNALEVLQSGNAFIRQIVRAGGAIDGKVWFDTSANAPVDLMGGKWTFDFDMEFYAPMEHIIWRAHRNPDYWVEVASAVANKINNTTIG